MKITNEFTVSAPPERAWDVLTDLERVVPLMPGAQLVGQEGDDYLGKVKVKVGPVTTEFSGKAHFVERDGEARRAVVDARGREARGSGNAAATVTFAVHEAGDASRVTVDTDLKIVGKLAQFGSGMLQQVSEKLLGEFVDSLEAQLAGGHTEAVASPTASPNGETQRPVPSRSTGRRFSVLSCWRLSSSHWDGCALRERRCAGSDDRAVAATRRRPGGLRRRAGQPAARGRCGRVRQRPSGIR
jgi:uncharacterized protein